MRNLKPVRRRRSIPELRDLALVEICVGGCKGVLLFCRPAGKGIPYRVEFD